MIGKYKVKKKLFKISRIRFSVFLLLAQYLESQNNQK